MPPSPSPVDPLEHSVSVWLTGLVRGDAAAAQKVWERYYQRLTQAARARLQGAPRTLADEEDVALSAFRSFCQGAAEGRFPRLDDRDDLWKLLLTIAARKAAAAIRREQAEKRGGGRVRGEEALGDPAEGDVLAAVLGKEPSPELAIEAAEQLEFLLGQLDDPLVGRIVVQRLEGRSVDEIARDIDRSPDTVQRKLALVRERWLREQGR